MDYTIPNKITESIFLGKSNSAQNLDVLQELGITHILMVGYDLEAKFPKQITYTHLEMDDKEGVNIQVYFDTACDFIDEAINSGGKILIHCHAGVSRSASIVIAYLIKQKKISYEEAREICRQGRPCINPNRGFVEQLRHWSKQHQ